MNLRVEGLRALRLGGLAAVAACFAGPSAMAANASGMQFGAAIPMTGRIAFVGENLLKGAQVALAGINGAGGVLGADARLTVEDTKGDAQSATVAITTLIGVDHVNALLGPTSATVMSVIDRVQESGTPAVFIGSTAALDRTVKGRSSWRLSHSDSDFGPAMALLAIRNGYKTCAVAVDSLEGAQSLKVTIVPAFKALGGSISRTLELAPDQASYRSELLDLFADPMPQCVFFEMSPDSAAQFWQNAGEFPALDKVAFLGSDFAISGDALKAMKPVADRVKMIALASAPIGPGRDAFKTAYAATYPEETEPALYSDFMWDAVNVLALAAQKAGSLDAAAISGQVDAIANPPGRACHSFAECKPLVEAGEDVNFEGAAGTNDVDETGNAHTGYGIFDVGRTVEPAGVLTAADVNGALASLRD